MMLLHYRNLLLQLVGYILTDFEFICINGYDWFHSGAMRSLIELALKAGPPTDAASKKDAWNYYLDAVEFINNTGKVTQSKVHQLLLLYNAVFLEPRQLLCYVQCSCMYVINWVWLLTGRFCALRAKDHGFESRYGRHVKTLGKSLTRRTLPVALQREIPTQYPCCVRSSSE